MERPRGRHGRGTTRGPPATGADGPLMRSCEHAPAGRRQSTATASAFCCEERSSDAVSSWRAVRALRELVGLGVVRPHFGPESSLQLLVVGGQHRPDDPLERLARGVLVQRQEWHEHAAHSDRLREVVDVRAVEIGHVLARSPVGERTTQLPVTGMAIVMWASSGPVLVRRRDRPCRSSDGRCQRRLPAWRVGAVSREGSRRAPGAWIASWRSRSALGSVASAARCAGWRSTSGLSGDAWAACGLPVGTACTARIRDHAVVPRRHMQEEARTLAPWPVVRNPREQCRNPLLSRDSERALVP